MKVKKEEVMRVKENANEAKHRLMEVLSELEEMGADKEAKKLEKMIWQLEVWQNT